MAPITNFLTVEQPEILEASSFQSIPMKRKRDSGCDAAWPAESIPDTFHMDHADPSVPKREPVEQGDETRRENAGFNEPAAVTSPNIATKNESKTSQGGVLWHEDPALSGKPF